MKTTKKQRKAARGMNHATREAFHRLGQTPEYGRFTRRRRLTLIQRANIHRIQYINPRNWGGVVVDRRPNCQARQYSDQMQCPRCGLAWDVNDDDPPACQTDGELGIKRLRDTLERRPHHDRG